MPTRKLSVKVTIEGPAKVFRDGDWQEVVMEQLREGIPDTVFFTTEDDEECELTVEIDN